MKNDKNNEKLQQKMNSIRAEIREANETAKMMKKDIKFDQMIVTDLIDNETSGNTPQKDEIRIKVSNFETGQINVWPIEKFREKLEMMRFALYQNENGSKLSEDQDPFNEKQEPMLLGKASYLM